jgi:hypothetical protein
MVRPSASFLRARKPGLERTSNPLTASVDKAVGDVERSDGVEVCLKEERERIKRLLNRNVRVTVGGMTVITMELGAKTATVQGSGPIWLQEGAKAPISLFDGEPARTVSQHLHIPTSDGSMGRQCVCCVLTPSRRPREFRRVQSGKYPFVVPHPYEFFSDHHLPSSAQFGCPTSASPGASSQHSPRSWLRPPPSSRGHQAHIRRYRLLCGSFTTPARLGIRTLQSPRTPISQLCLQACASSSPRTRTRTRGDPFALPRCSYE